MVWEFADLPWAIGTLWVTALAASFAIVRGMMVQSRKLPRDDGRRLSDTSFGFRPAEFPENRRSGMRRRFTDR